MANTQKQVFVAGNASKDEATAQQSFDTAMAAVAVYGGTGQSTGIQVITAGLNTWYDAGESAGTFYKYWAFIQYQST